MPTVVQVVKYKSPFPMVAIGNGLVLASATSGSALNQKITAISDNQGNEWLEATSSYSESTTPTTKATEIWYCSSARASGTLILSITSATDTSIRTLYLYEINDGVTFDVADNRSESGIPGAPAVIESATISPSDDSERFFVGIASETNIISGETPTVDSPWAMQPFTPFVDFGYFAYANATGDRSVMFSWLLTLWSGTSNTIWTSSIAAFIGPPAGPCPGPTPPLGNPFVSGCS